MENLIKELKHSSLFPAHLDGSVTAFDRLAIERMIPHRPPLLLIDQITGLSLPERLIRGLRHIKANDPVFLGHFPGYPIYPGVLQIEMVAQLGLCLAYFVLNNTNQVDSQHRPVMAMVTKVHHASFHVGVFPEQHLTIYSKVVEFNEITGLIAGQLFCSDKLCSYFILEAYFNE